IKGVGEGIIVHMVHERNRHGAFADMNDFCLRVGAQALNKRVLEAMVLAGALDHLGPNRASLFAHIPDAMKAAAQVQTAAATGMGDLFGGFDAPETAIAVAIPALEPWPDADQLKKEKDTLGLYLTGHPINAFSAELKNLVSEPLASLNERLDAPAPGTYAKGEPVIVAGLCMSERIVRQQNGDRQLFITLDDGGGRCEVRITGDEIDRVSRDFGRDALMIVEGDAAFDSFNGGIRVRSKRLLTLEQARLEKARGLFLELSSDCSANQATQILATLRPHLGGGVPISVRIESEIARAVVRLGADWLVPASDTLLNALKSAPGIDHVTVLYRR
ncbi:MAG: DNA polymerase III subunit alpha, partial [Halothiobacillus sp.]